MQKKKGSHLVAFKTKSFSLVFGSDSTFKTCHSKEKKKVKLRKYIDEKKEDILYINEF
jgi:hypothetical protein